MNNMHTKHFLSITTLLTAISISTIGCSSDSVQSQPTTTQYTNTTFKKEISSNASTQEKVDTYLQLLKADHVPAESYAQFLTQNSNWPNRHIFIKLMQQSLLNETDKKIIADICQTQSITTSDALSFCSQQDKITDKLIQDAKNAWINSVTTLNDEQAIQNSFGKYFNQQDQWQRFQRLESYGLLSAASRQIQNLTTSEQQLAQTILAFRRNISTAENTLSGLNKQQLKDPSLVYARLRWLRLQNRNDEALNLWKQLGFQTERNSTEKRFWNERSNLIYSFLSNNDNKSAYNLAQTDACNNDTCIYDSNFLAGWISLRKLNKTSESIGYFKKLTESNSILTKSRGYYWLGRAYSQMNQQSSARQAWQHASQFPTAFYGQLSIAELHNINKESVILNPSLLKDILPKYLQNIQEPTWSSSDIKSFKNKELVEAANILVSQGNTKYARPFLLAVNKTDNDPTSQAMNASVANEYGLPDDAVAIARNAGGKGIALLKNGWPRPYIAPTSNLPNGLELGIMRQESSFNPSIVSHSNAYGLMQLLPSTAKEIAVKIGLPAKMGNPANLVSPENNMRLGTAYLEGLMTRFNNVVPYSIAGYNAGPNRVKQWLTSIGNPTNTQGAPYEIIDWIEQIPYSETRNYVQRVVENMMIYQTNINK